MSLKRPQPEAVRRSCAKCGGQATTGDVWGWPMCDQCFDAWHEAAPGAGEALKMLTQAEAPDGLTGPAYRRWTAKWLKRPAAEVAA